MAMDHSFSPMVASSQDTQAQDEQRSSATHHPSVQEPEKTVPPSISHVNRRAFLTGAASLATLTLTQVFTNRLYADTSHTHQHQDPTKVPGRLATPYGARSSFEQSSRLTKSQRSFTPHQDLHGIVTPSALHFERHHNGIPRIDPTKHRLLIHGLVARPMVFTLEELQRFPSISRLAFIECSGNSGKEWAGPKGKTVQVTHGLLSTSEWTGVALSTVLHHVGLSPEAQWMLAEGSDAAALTRSIPLAQALDEALICYAQNGEALRPEQGFPLRLLVPGWEGNTCVKWLRRLKLSVAPFMTREETSKYTDLMPDGTARQFTLVMDAKSVITSPSGGQHIQPGFVEIRGLGWTGRGTITKVEVTTDQGQTWQEAELQEPILPKCTTRFRLPWFWNGQSTTISSRCTDSTGYIQPTGDFLRQERGTNSYYHFNGTQHWRIDRDGKVSRV